MTQMPLFTPMVWTVTRLSRYLRDLLESDEVLQDIWVQGEVSNLSRPASGHLYFTIKDSSSSLKCVMWRSMVQRQSYLPRDGEAIEIHGSLSLYEISGQYQLYVDALRPLGEGILYQEFLRLKTRLENEGLFAESRKRTLPSLPSVIGLVTSPTGAAIRDILQTLQRRYPLVKVVLAPTSVQGEEAPVGIVRALAGLNRLIKPDVIILARGGGSIEDLWPFNDEKVARAIVESSAPVITGVGHETDFTIADFVSDFRAPTPTAAAEIATPDRLDLKKGLINLNSILDQNMRNKVHRLRWQQDRQESRLIVLSPQSRIHSARQSIDEYTHRKELALINRQKIYRTNLINIQQRLRVLSPQSILSRGYAIIKHDNDQIVRSIHQIEVGEALKVQVSDGHFGVLVQKDSA